jgi:hypothetical protein
MEEATADARGLETGWLPDTPVDDSILRRFAFSQAEVNEAFATTAPGGRCDRDGEVALADSGGPIAYYNQAFLLRPLAGGGDPVLDRVESFFADGPAGRPVTLLSMWPTPDLAARGWSLVGHPMVVVRGAWGDGARPDDAALVRELGPGDVGEFERVIAEGYPIPEAQGLPAGSVVGPGVLDRGIRLRVGVADGVPVAAAAGYVAHGIVNLCSAATLPAARRRGVWGALVRARMADGPGLPAVAYTSDHSRPGFVHMGFLPICRFTLWAR